jgi:NAD(P)-dependent dehydrogenase (short-subunit alcohol dehydrogenase family)
MFEKSWWIIVGGTKRLGLALAQQMAHSHNLVLTSSKTDEADGELSKLSNSTGIRRLHWDANDSRLALKMMTDFEALRGDGICLDGAILVAGTFPFTPLGSWSGANLQQIWQVNLTFPFLVIQSLAPHLLEGSCIQLILDACIHRPYLNRLPYSAAKSGLAALLPGLAQLLAPKIRVVGHAIGTMLPDDASSEGFLQNQTLLKHIGSPEELGRAIAFAADSPSLTGEVLTLDGGWRWA